MELLEILELLDHENDDHWTDDGLPRVDLIKQMVDDDAITVTRTSISNAAPKLVRGSPIQADQEPDPESIEAIVPKDMTVEEKAAVRAEYDEQLAHLEEERQAINKHLKETQEAFLKKTAEINALINERDDNVPAMTPIEAVREINKRNVEERRKRAERSKALGFTPSSLTHAMKSSGQRRPDYNAHMKRV
jgi:hypothetical protein